MLGEGNHFIPNMNEGIQIHHVGNHWVTSSSDVFVFMCVCVCYRVTFQNYVSEIKCKTIDSLHAEVIYTFQFSKAEIACNRRCHSEGRS